jgi:hypothetical protein
MSMVALVDLDEEVRGDTVIYDLTLSRAGALAGWMNGGTIRFVAKLKLSDADEDAIFVKESPASGITWVDQAALNPTATVLIEPEDYEDLLPGKAKTLVYEIEIEDVGGRVETVQKGSLPILADVVRGA